MTIYNGKTLEEAIANAADDKGCSTEQIQYSVQSKEDDSVTIDAFSNDDIKEFLFDYLGNFFTGIDLDTECAIEETQDGFIVNLNAENNATLIGKMGRTIAAFNTVVRSAVNAQFKSRVNVLIDINHYKEDRYSKLRYMAKRIAFQVRNSHVDVELDPMPNDERKVIHQYLNNWKNISTESKGEGSNRHLCIKYTPVQQEEKSAEVVDTETQTTVAVEE